MSFIRVIGLELVLSGIGFPLRQTKEKFLICSRYNIILDLVLITQTFRPATLIAK